MNRDSRQKLLRLGKKSSPYFCSFFFYKISMSSSLSSASASGSTSTSNQASTHYFACRYCRQPLFLPHQLEQKHQPHQHEFSLQKQRKQGIVSIATTHDNATATPSEETHDAIGEYYRDIFKDCSSWFLYDPLQWMRQVREPDEYNSPLNES